MLRFYDGTQGASRKRRWLQCFYRIKQSSLCFRRTPIGNPCFPWCRSITHTVVRIHYALCGTSGTEEVRSTHINTVVVPRQGRYTFTFSHNTVVNARKEKKGRDAAISGPGAGHFSCLVHPVVPTPALCGQKPSRKHTRPEATILVERCAPTPTLARSISKRVHIGSFHENFSRNAWGFHKRNLKEYGGVVKLKMFLGVSFPSTICT